MNFQEKLLELENRLSEFLKNKTNHEETENLRVHILGRNGELTQILRNIGELPATERPKAGEAANNLRQRFEKAISEHLQSLKEAVNKEKLLSEKLDVTLPGRRYPVGRLHPLTLVLRQIIEIFKSLEFHVASGPEIELDHYNFEALNIPKDHPARDMQDTFYITDDVLLRTQTSPVQIRVMEKLAPPIRIIAPGAVYRHDFDVTHSPMFHQVEGLLVDEKVSFAELKGTLQVFVHRLFDPDTALRFRPSYFPFTEPSAEVDIQCILCRGKGCRVCSQTGWLEVLGCGLVHPAVFQAVGYDPKKYSGFAFGIGIERIAMLKYGIDDIRAFFENDVRLLQQFSI